MAPEPRVVRHDACDPLLEEIRAFVACVRGDARPAVPAAAGRAAVAVAQAVRDAIARQGRS